MAASDTKRDLCMICLEAPDVRKVDTCQHSYCENCLSSPNFSCPQCVNDNLESGRSKKELAARGESEKPTAGDCNNAPLVAAICKLCHHRGTTVKAVNVCRECRNMPLCLECSLAHRKNKFTKNHVVTCLVYTFNKQEVLCDAHNEPLTLFCTTCSLIVCHVCVSLDHVDHDVETFNDVVNTEVEKVRSALEIEEEWLDVLKSDDKELQASKAIAQEIEDVLIKSIEDHAEKCIKEIMKKKEVLKTQVKADCEVVRVMENWLEAMSELQKASADVVAAADQLLNEQAELHSTFVKKLIGLKTQLDELKEGHHAYELNKKKYQRAFKELRENSIRFYPRMPNCNIGGFEDLYAVPRCNDGGPCVCETCERKADSSRVDECRQKGTCTCGTCGCVFNRARINKKGRCACKFQCDHDTRCNRCGSYVECEGRAMRCENIIAVQNYIP
ncbi:E3 ubiquitin-protein ligase TRIM56-like [Lineus longissimus]|uniref:E3 ubiquitin-protein ligase TRIM56-like n=1 Tax=Lineus longissimus TaxID=88925 RepID=UPI00315CBD0B